MKDSTVPLRDGTFHHGAPAEVARVTRPTIIDVAERAGVSKSLVSLVLRDAGRVSPGRREAVLTAARELGYRPNAVARSLVRQRSHVLGVMLSDLHNPYFAECVDGIAELADGYRTILTTGHLDRTREMDGIETLLELQVDGLLLVGSTVTTSAIRTVSLEVPIVTVTRAVHVDSVDSVVNDDRAGAALVVDHLVALGHRRIAHIDGGGGAGARSRRTGYERAMGRHGLAAHVMIARGAFTRKGGAHGMRVLLAANDRPTAVFVANDLAATGVLEVLDRAGLRVPEDISIVGYDNTQLAGSYRYDLTTVDQPRREMGRRAVSLLLERIRGERDTPRHVVLSPTLVVRRSTGPPPR